MTNTKSLKLLYKEISNTDILNTTDENKIIYLSRYNDNDVIKPNQEEYIYNDTNSDITIEIKDKCIDQDVTNTFVIEKEKIYTYDWTIDETTVKYIK